MYITPPDIEETEGFAFFVARGVQVGAVMIDIVDNDDLEFDL